MPTVHFVINLLQDVNVARPCAIYARSMGFDVVLLVSDKFRQRDSEGLWWGELQSLSGEFGMVVVQFDSPMAAYLLLQSTAGVVIACSESNLPGHDLTHELHRAAPPHLVRITLQHGFECVGFLHNQAHDQAHGSTITFAADIVCGWVEADRLSGLAPSERPKLRVTGPTSQLMPQQSAPRERGGALICENLHSVRLNRHQGLKSSFMDIFGDFVSQWMKDEKAVSLRPHPGGRYTIKNKVTLPAGVLLNTHPIYKTPLAAFSFGISAPSSVVIDMVLAGLPVGLWQDADERIDIANYQGLTRISSARDWLAFARDVELRPETILDRQRSFLVASKLVHETTEVRARYGRLLAAATAHSANAAPMRRAG